MSGFQRGEPEDRDGAYVVRVAFGFGVAFWNESPSGRQGWVVVWDESEDEAPDGDSGLVSGDDTHDHPASSACTCVDPAGVLRRRTR